MMQHAGFGLERSRNDSNPWWTGWLYGFVLGACLAAVTTAYALCHIVEQGVP